MRTSSSFATLALTGALVGALATLPACIADEDLTEDDLPELSEDDVVVQERRILNGMGPDDFWNPIIQSSSAMEKMRTKSLNQLAADSSFTALVSDRKSRAFLTKLLYCALPWGTTMRFTTPTGTTISFPGWMGLASGWQTRGITQSEREKVSACTLALVNGYKRTVLVDMRGEPTSQFPTSEAERAQYDQEEATFFGDIFTPDTQAVYDAMSGNDLNPQAPLFPNMYACWDEGYIHGEDYVDGRVCGFTVCVAQPLGSCNQICEVRDGTQLVGDGDNQQCWTGKWEFYGWYGNWGVRKEYADHPVTVFLTSACDLAGAGNPLCSYFI